MDIFIGVIVGLIVLMVLVTLHEFGHFLAARRNGVNVLEFGIGFPPRAVAWVKDEKTGKWRKLKRSEWVKDKTSKVVYSEAKKGFAEKGLTQKGMIFSLNFLPIGGFCQMDGESAADERAGTFGKASFWAKTKILFAGVAANWLVAILIFTVLAWTGMPEFIDGQFTVSSDTRRVSEPVEIVMVAEGSPAEKAGILAGDKILAVDGCNCDADFETAVVLNPEGSEYLLGVQMASTQSLSYSTWSAPIVGVGLTAQLTGETFKGVGVMLWNLVSGTARLFSPDAGVREDGQEAISSVGDSVSGPVGIIGVLFPAFTSAGPTNLAFLAALISVSLACMNVLPIPALDGGRWLLIAIYKLRKKKLTKEVEEKIVSRAFMVLLALIFIVTILDVVRLANGW